MGACGCYVWGECSVIVYVFVCVCVCACFAEFVSLCAGVHAYVLLRGQDKF